MIIKNFEKLATSVLRRQALTIAEAGFEAINTEKAIQSKVIYNPQKQILVVSGKKYDLKKYKKTVCAGIGKAAFDAVRTIKKILGDRIEAGYVIDLKNGYIPGIITRVGSHPQVSEDNIRYSKELVFLLEDLKADDLAIVVASGGGSALLELPNASSAQDLARIFDALTKQGASISEINTVRKHLSRVKGGQLAKIIYPATCVSLIFSDVPGDDLSMVASGPTVKDSSSVKEAQTIVNKYNLLEHADLPSLKFIETPKEGKFFEQTHDFLLVSGKTALLAMKEKAEDLGFSVGIFTQHYFPSKTAGGNIENQIAKKNRHLWSHQNSAGYTYFEGEARKLGPEIIQQNLKKGQCLLGTGESTVIISGKGRGGRNQEMALSALFEIAENQILLCLASDGHDNTEAAGAIVDTSTLVKARALNLDPKKFLKDNDSFTFFEKVDDAVITELTGSNVADFFVCLKS